MKIQELAKLAGVSPSTISRVFSHHPNISEEVREKIFVLARKYHYHPRLSTKQRNVVIITPYNCIYPVQCCVEMLLMALTRELPKHGFRIEILPQDNLERLDSIQFCAAVAIGSEPEDFRDWSSRFATPLILVDRKSNFRSPEVYTVRSNETQGMELAVDHLYSRGCRRIGCIIHGKPGTGNADLRCAALRESLKKRNLAYSEMFIQFANDEEYLEIIGQMLKQNIDSLFCPGGSGGIIASYALSLFERKIPEDVSLVASEQIFYSRYATPPQTTVTQDYPAVASAVAEVIETRIGNEKAPSETVLPYLLLSRGSVRNRPS
ncbi:MAG: HTH-type transcriptional regulator DegA [Lentisphaerae bacterium ADurb.Bin242]|nr:MAG: HTH-type transcriptional regulator DegA [Lentisphaerae bacterium ADurb.Bin242]